ncbi:MAG: M20/M25/M40 family metallo-hydrolase, partial [Gemmatimonadaceae bacterium]
LVRSGSTSLTSRNIISASAIAGTMFASVPPYIAPRMDGDRLFGRGACDAKGIAAAMLVAADRLATAGEQRVDLLFVVGEEKGSDGARAANRLAETSRFLVNGEPTESKLASGAKGSLRVIARTRGRAAHSAYAHLGESAIKPMLELLPTLDSIDLPTDPILGNTTVNIGTIHGGTEANIVPAMAEAEMMFRLVSDVEPLRTRIDAWAKGRAELEYGSHIPAQHFHVIPGFETAPMAYTSDIPLLGRWGTPLMFGPGSIHVAHTPDEFIDVRELRAAVDSYERIIRSLLAS